MSWKKKQAQTRPEMIDKLQERLVMKWPHCNAHGNASHLFERELPVGSVVRFTTKEGDYTTAGAVHATPGVWVMMRGDRAAWSDAKSYATEDLRSLMDQSKYDWAHIQ